MDMKYLYAAKDMAKKTLLHTGAELLQNYGNVAHTTKAHAADIVTELDGKTEEYLLQQFNQFDSTIGFRGEETGTRSDATTTWLVDPIDGTDHFVRGLPFCTSMVALVQNGQVVLSIIHNFVSGDMFWAIKGEGAYCNGERLEISQRQLSNSLIVFESNLGISDNATLRERLRKRTNFMQVRTSGFEFAMVASGKLEGRIAKDPYAEDWDCAPGSLLVQEAGGIVTNIGMTTYDYTNHDYLALSPAVYEELVNGDDAIFPLVKG